MKAPPSFPSLLVWWRKRRGFSQLQLAMAADCSQRHISFLELGRTKPSREMVLRLATALDIPLRHSNELLLAAGYAPVWTETALGAPVLTPVGDALDYMLTQQEPFPAVVVDRRWNVLQANKGAIALVEFLVGPLTPGVALNLADALVAPDVLRPHLSNWEDIVRYFLRSVEADAAADGTAETAALLERLLRHKGVRSVMSPVVPQAAEGPVLAMHFHKGATRLRLFTTIATLGTPQDVTLQELRIESFFAMDDETRGVSARRWATIRGPVPPQMAGSSPAMTRGRAVHIIRESRFMRVGIRTPDRLRCAIALPWPCAGYCRRSDQRGHPAFPLSIPIRAGS
jgi:transcriptional regulator with XRE-family HTH domain